MNGTAAETIAFPPRRRAPVPRGLSADRPPARDGW
jgi:hypothetical protein